MTRPGELNFPAEQKINDELKRVLQLLRGRLTVHENVRVVAIAHTFNAVANTEDSIDISSLKISWTPRYWWVIRQDRAGSIYESNFGTWSSTTVKFKCSVANVVATIAFA